MCLHRWLGYITLLLFDVLICLLVLFGLIRNSKGTLIAWVSQDSRANSCDLENDLAEWRLPYMKPLLHYCSVHTKKFLFEISALLKLISREHHIMIRSVFLITTVDTSDIFGLTGLRLFCYVLSLHIITQTLSISSWYWISCVLFGSLNIVQYCCLAASDFSCLCNLCMYVDDFLCFPLPSFCLYSWCYSLRLICTSLCVEWIVKFSILNIFLSAVD